MKQLSTKSLESLLVATVKAIKSSDQKTAIRHLDRILRRHDPQRRAAGKPARTEADGIQSNTKTTCIR